MQCQTCTTKKPKELDAGTSNKKEKLNAQAKGAKKSNKRTDTSNVDGNEAEDGNEYEDESSSGVDEAYFNWLITQRGVQTNLASQTTSAAEGGN